MPREKRSDEIRRRITQEGLSISEVMRRADVSHNTLDGWDKEDPKSFRIYDSIMEAIDTLCASKYESL